jgi:hypothetical protein
VTGVGELKGMSKSLCAKRSEEGVGGRVPPETSHYDFLSRMRGVSYAAVLGSHRGFFRGCVLEAEDGNVTYK